MAAHKQTQRDVAHGRAKRRALGLPLVTPLERSIGHRET